MKIGDQVTLVEEAFKWWPELKGKKLTIWHIEPTFIYIKVGKRKGYYAWDKDWFIYGW